MKPAKTVQEALAGLVTGDKHFDFVQPQIESSELAMKTIHGLAAKIVQGGQIRQSDLLSAVASALSIGIKVGLEMAGYAPIILGPGGGVVQ